MRLLHRTGPGALGLNYMWLPTWIGMNGQLIKEIDQHVGDLLGGKVLTEELLEEADGFIIDFLVKKFPEIKGLFEYLDGLKYVETNASSTQESTNGQAAHPGA